MYLLVTFYNTNYFVSVHTECFFINLNKTECKSKDDFSTAIKSKCNFNVVYLIKDHVQCKKINYRTFIINLLLDYEHIHVSISGQFWLKDD